MIYSYTWFHEGSVISNETNAILTGVGRFGTYICKVTNEAGVGMDSIILNFTGEHKIEGANKRLASLAEQQWQYRY